MTVLHARFIPIAAASMALASCAGGGFAGPDYPVQEQIPYAFHGTWDTPEGCRDSYATENQVVVDAYGVHGYDGQGEIVRVVIHNERSAVVRQKVTGQTGETRTVSTRLALSSSDNTLQISDAEDEAYSRSLVRCTGR